VRQYAALALVKEGETDRARARHAAYYAALAERAALGVTGSDPLVWLGQFELERDNLRAALRWTVEQGAFDDRLRLPGALQPLWEARGYLSEGRRWLDRVLAAAQSGGVSPVLHNRARLAGGLMAKWQGDLENAWRLLAEAVTVARELGERRD